MGWPVGCAVVSDVSVEYQTLGAAVGAFEKLSDVSLGSFALTCNELNKLNKARLLSTIRIISERKRISYEHYLFIYIPNEHSQR